jgi:hypothetical protein
LYAAAAGSSESEFYFYIAPSINYQLYDATIQSLFNRSPITFSLVPYRFNGEAGFKYKVILICPMFFVYRGKELYSKTSSGYFLVLLAFLIYLSKSY